MSLSAWMMTWSQSWSSPKHFPDWARIQLLVLTRSNTWTLRTCQKMTWASSSHCTKKASRQDKFRRIGHTVTSSGFATRQGLHQAEWILYPTMKSTAGKLMEVFVDRKLAQDQERRKILLPNQGGYRAGKTTSENAARFTYEIYKWFQRKEQTLPVAVLSGRYVQQSTIETAHGTHWTNMTSAWCSWDGMQQYSQERRITIQLESWSPPSTTDNGTSTRLSPVPQSSRLQCLHKGTGLRLVLSLADDGFIYKSASKTHTAVADVQAQLEKVS